MNKNGKVWKKIRGKRAKTPASGTPLKEDIATKFDPPALPRITATVPGMIVTERVESDPVHKHKS